MFQLRVVHFLLTELLSRQGVQPEDDRTLVKTCSWLM